MKKKSIRILCALFLCLLLPFGAAHAFTMQSEMITISIGQEVKMQTTSSNSLTWKSANTSIATVSGGTIKGIRAGYSIVTATGGGETAYVGVKVIAGKTPTAVTLSQSSMKLYAGSSKKLTAAVTPGDATDKSGKWISTNKKVATVSKTGVVKGVGVGKCKIWAVASSGVMASCDVTVLETPVTAIKLSAKSGKLTIGKTVTLTATVSPADAANPSLTWYSTDKTVATVTQNGEITALSAGKAKIVAQSVLYPDVKAVCTITVVPVMVTSVKIVPKAMTVSVGAKVTLASSVLPVNATDDTLVWKSSKPGIVHVENGVITAVSKGKAVITATAKDGSKKKATCEITVK